MPVHAGLEHAAAAMACERVAGREQAFKRRLVRVATRALVQHGAVGIEPEGRQRAQLALGSPGDFAWRIDILDPYQPLPACAPGQQPAPQCSHQRAQMQRTRRRRCEAPAIRERVGGGHIGPT